MEDKLKKIKVLFADVDQTLLLLKMYGEEGKRVIGFSDYEDWLKFNIFNDAYINCVAPKGVYNFVKMMHDNGVKVYGLTEASNSFEYNSKVESLKRCYKGIFKHHNDIISIDTRHKKILIMKMIAERDGLQPDEIAFIDDSYSEVMEAFDASFFSMHTTEVMERFKV